MDFFLTRDVFQDNKKYFDNQMSEYVFYSKYSRWRDDLGRREVWSETVERACNYLIELSENKLSKRDYKRIHDAMLRMEVMPSMRLLAMAGKAARRSPVSCFNCASTAMNEIAAFVEIMYLSMNGVGVGFSVERQFTNKLPVIQRQHVSPRGNIMHTVPDSTEGWCDAFRMGLSIWWGGGDVVFDYSQIRPAGAVLKTKGGTASGYLPLKKLLDFSRDLILRNQGKRLSTVDVYDIVTKTADCVVMGGVRRSACLCLFDFDDDAMMTSKNGEYWVDRPWRSNANNSAVWTRELTKDEIDAFFEAMHDGFNGEPGFFSRYATMKTLPIRRDREHVYGTNACVTGDTLVAVADGRGVVRFDELAKDGKDIPVYAADKKGKTVVRMMRNPRQTGFKPVYRVMFDGGDYIDATDNHKFMGKDGKYVRVKDLSRGHRVRVIHRFEGLITLSKDKSNRSLYKWIRGSGYKATEHGLISDFFSGNRRGKNDIVHHKDFNSLNNAPNNLVVMTKSEHRTLHNDINLGDGNPMKRWMATASEDRIQEYRNLLSSQRAGELNSKYSGHTGKQILDGAIELCNILGRRFSTREWYAYVKKNGMPMNFEAFREKETGFKTIYEMSIHACNLCEFDGCEQPISTQRAILENNKLLEMWSAIFNKLALDLGREPKQPEFITKCKDDGIRCAVFSKNSPMRGYRLLSNYSRGANHIVRSVEYIGEKPVFNGTVDEFHNYYIGGWDNPSDAYKKRETFVNCKNCGEAVLPLSDDGGGLCNLTQVVARSGDTVNQLCDKAEIATIIGTIQSLATDFHFLRPGWKHNAERERLTGIDITGHYDCEEARNPLTQIAMKSCVVMTNKRVAKELGIPQATATTLVKPSGNSGVLLNVSSGVHPRWSKFYKRNVRVNVNSPLFEVLKRSSMPMVQESDTTYVIGFAIKSPDGAITRDQVDAKTHLEYWKQVKTCYAEHSVSMTCYYGEDELDFVKQWIYENQDVVSGLSFLPRSDAKYENAPYVDLTEEEYYELKTMEPVIDFGLLQDIEHVDGTESSHELSCSAGQCDMRL